MAPRAVDKGAQRIKGPDGTEPERTDLGVPRIQVGQQGGCGGEDRQCAHGLAGDSLPRRNRVRTGLSRNKRQQPDGGDASGGVRRPRQPPPSAIPQPGSSLSSVLLSSIPSLCVPGQELAEMRMVTRQRIGTKSVNGKGATSFAKVPLS